MLLQLEYVNKLAVEIQNVRDALYEENTGGETTTLMIARTLLKVFSTLDTFSRQQTLAESSSEWLDDINRALRPQRYLLDQKYFQPIKTADRNFFSIHSFLFNLDCRLNLLCNEKFWLKERRSLADFARLTPYLNNPSFFGAPRSAVADRSPIFSWSLTKVYSFLLQCVKMEALVDFTTEDIQALHTVLELVYNRFCILACLPETGSFLLSGSKEMTALIQEIHAATGVVINETQPVLNDDSKAHAAAIVDILTKYDNTMQDFSVRENCVLIGSQSLSDLVSPSLDLDQFVVAERYTAETIRLKLKLTGLFDFGILFDTLFVKLQLSRAYNADASGAVVNERKSVELVQRWVDQSIDIAKGDNYDVVYKHDLIAHFEPLALRQIYQRISTVGAVSTEKLMQSFLEDGADSVRQLYVVGDTPIKTIQDMQFGIPLARQVMHRSVINYMFQRKVGLNFEKQIMTTHPGTDTFFFARIFKAPFRHRFFLLSREKACVSSAKTIVEIFAQWLLYIFKSTQTIDAHGQTRCLLTDSDTDEEKDAYKFILDVLF